MKEKKRFRELEYQKKCPWQVKAVIYIFLVIVAIIQILTNTEA